MQPQHPYLLNSVTQQIQFYSLHTHNITPLFGGILNSLLNTQECAHNCKMTRVTTSLMATARRATARRAIMATTTTMAMGDDDDDDDDGDGATGNEVDDHGDGATGDDDGHLILSIIHA